MALPGSLVIQPVKIPEGLAHDNDGSAILRRADIAFHDAVQSAETKHFVLVERNGEIGAPPELPFCDGSAAQGEIDAFIFQVADISRIRAASVPSPYRLGI